MSNLEPVPIVIELYYCYTDSNMIKYRGNVMTTVTFNLPDSLASEAQAVGLLTSEALEAMLRESLRRKASDQLFQAIDKLHAADLPPLNEEEIQEEVDAVRAEKRARA